jgi:ribonuclease BN (tRNA processing enzyme)
VKFQLLPSTFEPNGSASPRQHLTCFVIDDSVAFDAGSLAMAASPLQRQQIRDVVLTHAHLDHIAGLPLFVDDLFATLARPVRIHASQAVIDILERDVFNWSVYPRFSELTNDNGIVMEYSPFCQGVPFNAAHLEVRALEVNHKVPSSGFLISDGRRSIGLSGDTAEMDGFWDYVNKTENISAVLLECAFPDELQELANLSHHLTPARVAAELGKCKADCPIYIVNLKPMYRDEVIRQLAALHVERLEILQVGRVYEW